ncbi:MAG: twin-arginine translocase subunit TatC [Nitriliruptoraceae bacterium]
MSGTAGEMPLVEHLRELRTRLFRAVIALAVGTVIGYVVFPLLLDLLIAPYCDIPNALRPDTNQACSLIATKPLEPFSVRIRTALVIGLFVAGPAIFFQLWRFIAPGLTSREKRFSLPFVISAQLLFAIGIGFAYLIVPRALRVLLALGGPGIEPLLAATDYLSFFLALCIAFGLVFELPLVLITLVLLRVVKASGLRRARPYAIVAMAVAAAFITPTTDAVTLLFVVGPAWVFYELSILVAWWVERRRRRRAGTAETP